MSDKKLWNKFRNGDKIAFEAIYRDYFKDLYSYGRKFSTDTSLIEDCIQEMFIELWNKKEGLSETDKIKPYLYVSLRRKIIGQVKKKRNDSGIELQDHHFKAELSFEHLLIQKESTVDQRQKIEAAFKELSDRQREILYLKFYSKLDYEAISEIMDMNYQSARNLVSRAIAKLTKIMSIQLVAIVLEMIKF